MPTNNIIRFHITPQTHVRSTQGDAVLFQIPEECPKHCGLPRRSKNAQMIEVPDKKKPGKMKQVRYGCPHMLSQEGLDRKRRLQQYNDYKTALNALALQQRFSVPSFGWSLYFFIPIKDSMYKPKKNYENSKRFQKHGTIHDVKPDWDNFGKAFQDALVKQDGVIGQLSGIGKFWVDVEPHEGWIEVHLNQPLYDPFNKYGKKELDDVLLNTKIDYKQVDKNAFDSSPRMDKYIMDETSQYITSAVKGDPVTVTITKENHVSVNDKSALEEVFRRNKNRKRK